jgi:DNA-entry nuclease
MIQDKQKQKEETGRRRPYRSAAARRLAVLAAALLLGVSAGGALSGCTLPVSTRIRTERQADPAQDAARNGEAKNQEVESDSAPRQSAAGDERASQADNPVISLDSIPAYKDSPVVEINGNVPFFTDEEKTENTFEHYSELDSLGRCQAAFACVGQETIPTEERGEIGRVRPTGWHTVKYAGVDGNYLYNRCHLIAYSLAGENANEKNLITGTRYMNTKGMLPYEGRVADYIHITGHHVLYRVTPIFEGDNLLASGVLMEAESMEDDGISFCVYCYNVQPGVSIDYATGESSGPEFKGSGAGTSASQQEVSGKSGDIAGGGTDSGNEAGASSDEGITAEKGEGASGENTDAAYILNTNTKKFHRPSCSSVKQISQQNRQEFTGARDELIQKGYDPCKRCNP